MSIVGFYGYLVYGPAVGGADHGGSITLNLPKDDVLAISARIVISFAILLSTPLQFYVAVSIIFPNVISERVPAKRHLLAEYILRYSIIIICCKYVVVIDKVFVYYSHIDQFFTVIHNTIYRKFQL